MSFGVMKESEYVGAAGPAVPGTQYVGTKLTPLVSTGQEKWHTVNGNFPAFDDSVAWEVPEDGLYYIYVCNYKAWANLVSGGTSYAVVGGFGVWLIDAWLEGDTPTGHFAVGSVVLPLAKGEHIDLYFHNDAGVTDVETTYRPYYYIAKLEEELV